MALRFMDGFDHYAIGNVSPATHDLLKRWTAITHFGGGTGCQSQTVSSGRFGAGFQGSDSNCEFWLAKSLDSQPTWIVGLAVRWGGFTSPAGLIALNDGGTAGGGNTQLSLYPNTSRGLDLYRGDGITFLGGTESGILVASTWYYIELKATIDNAGTAAVRINGASALTFSGDTQATGNASASAVLLGGDRTQSGTTIFDDVYMCDGTGGSPYNDFLGDIRVETLYPNGNGATSNFTGSDGNSTDNYLLVDEAGGHDGDTTYVESGTINDKDTYAYTNLTNSTGTVYAVQPILEARKTDAGSRSVKSVARLGGGTEEDAASASALATGYSLYSDIRTTKPGGGSWSISDVNGSEFGIKVTA